MEVVSGNTDKMLPKLDADESRPNSVHPVILQRWGPRDMRNDREKLPAVKSAQEEINGSGGNQGWCCCSRWWWGGLNSATSPPHSEFTGSDLELWSDTQWARHAASSSLLSSAWNRIPRTPHSNCLRRWCQGCAQSARSGRTMFYRSDTQKTNRERPGEQRCISHVSVRDSLTFTQLLSCHMYMGRKTGACFLRFPSDLSSARKTSIPARAPVCAQRAGQAHNTCTHVFTERSIKRVRSRWKKTPRTRNSAH